MSEKYLLVLLFAAATALSAQLSSWMLWGTVGVCSLIAWFLIHQMEVKNQRKTWNFLLESLPPAITVGVNSIEELRQRALEIWTEREQMDLVLSEIREGVLAISPDDVVLLANDRAKEFLTLKDDIVGEEVSQKKFPKPARNVLKAAMKQEVTEQVWKEGAKPERRYFELLGFPMKEHLGALLVIRDITKLRRLERVRKDFIANISHELRTPVTVILMNVETLLDDEMMDLQTQKRFLDAIQRNSVRLSRLLNDLLDLSRIEAGQYALNLQEYPIRPIVEQVCRSLEERFLAKNQKMIIEIEEQSYAFFDRQALEQVLTNFVENAIKYTPNETTILIRNIEKNGCMRIEVEDNGTGIALKHQPRLFERFYRVDKGRSKEAGGTGLGLAIVRHLAETMGGKVGMRSAISGGAIFWVDLLIEQGSED